MTTIFETTLQYNLCSGCGVCVGMCPSKAIIMQWNPNGELNPVRIQPCPHECGLCVKVCPSLTTEETNEDTIAKQLYGSITDIGHTPQTGYHLTCGVGGVSDNKRRAECASGGLATWLLEQLLTEGVVDAVICVHHSSKKDRLFEYVVCHRTDEIRNSKGSAYYPNELSEVIHYMLQHDERYAIIGLPCCIKAIRLAQMKNKQLRERVKIIVGLVCSKVLDKHFTEYTAYISGLDGEPSFVQYRNTNLSHQPTCHTYYFENELSKATANPKYSGPLFHSGIFELPSCRYCDDIFAECADIVFMDAWLKEFTQTEPRGTSIYISRLPALSSIMQTGMKNNQLSIQPIAIDRVIQSQYGLARRKRLPYLIQLRKNQHQYVPSRRFGEGADQLNIYGRYLARNHLNMGIKGKEKWLHVHGNCKKYSHWVACKKLQSLPVRLSAGCMRILISRLRPLITKRK